MCLYVHFCKTPKHTYNSPYVVLCTILCHLSVSDKTEHVLAPLTGHFTEHAKHVRSSKISFYRKGFSNEPGLLYYIFITCFAIKNEVT